MNTSSPRKQTPGRFRQIALAGVGIAAGLLAFGTAPSFAQTAAQGPFNFPDSGTQAGRNIPSADSRAAIAAPSGHFMTMSVYANGTQDYQCRKNATGYGWAFTGPRANLFGDGKVGDHFNLQGTSQAGTPADGPRWRFNDGTQVRGRLVSSAPSLTANDIPVLLLRVEYESRRSPSYTSYFGTAVQNATFLQRTQTVGGVAPAANSCTAFTVGTVAKVPYRATYLFWSPPPPPPEPSEFGEPCAGCFDPA
jgi:Protein of unknown function (DUF3455)